MRGIPNKGTNILSVTGDVNKRQESLSTPITPNVTAKPCSGYKAYLSFLKIKKGNCE